MLSTPLPVKSYENGGWNSLNGPFAIAKMAIW